MCVYTQAPQIMTKRKCPSCGTNIKFVQSSDISVKTESGVVFPVAAVCFCCPECHTVLGVAPETDTVETSSRNTESSIDELLIKLDALLKLEKKQ